ncbi:hypothetical protein J8273_6595 [Carpediemonas membranifera]|uniref:Uncharacterized protein n=1 Tax=Carpediemonas membranifera TaxID=201153 RepID=A0A8J6E8J7_9EUKA|nr:hypothetical protein J8273_6595 [Carpediemonas membranifera]|eukprot:KAG9392005.1 hypothetical protein J8273_6595 [Carpediemonas membranifera]
MNAAKYRFLAAGMFVWVLFALYAVFVVVPTDMMRSVVVFPDKVFLSSIISIFGAGLIAVGIMLCGANHLVVVPFTSASSIGAVLPSECSTEAGDIKPVCLQEAYALWVRGRR